VLRSTKSGDELTTDLKANIEKAGYCLPTGFASKQASL
jgi:hypothetical protein